MSEMIATTRYGKLRGRQDKRFYAFLGVPFAKAPTGALRWKAPVAPDPWEGVLDATEYGYQSLQNNNLGHADRKGLSEDCLNLNIWTPGVDGKKRPVVIMYSGGGSTNGGNDNPVFNGDSFCGDREVVMVFANFRLGMLGFLYLGHLLGEEYQTSGNCGLMDQIFALKWVHENIDAFGGDPDNITIMGQSAGGKTVSNMMLSPWADGLYKKVIAMSGAHQVIRDLETSRVITDRFLALNGIPKSEAASLLSMPGEQILAMQEKYYSVYDHVTGPVYDGVVLPLALEERLLPGEKKGISVLIGHTEQEYAVMPQRLPDDETLRQKLGVMYGISGEHVYAVYREYCRTMPRYMAWARLMTQYNYGDASVRYAGRLARAGAQVWCYRWDYPGTFRPAHGTDLSYVCGYAKDELKGPKPQHFDEVCSLMNASFMNFIEHGNPQAPDTADWQPYTDTAEGTRMYFTDYPAAEPFSLENYDHDFPDSQLILKEER